MTQFGGLNRCACKVVSTGTGTTFTKVKEYFNVNYIEVLRYFSCNVPYSPSVRPGNLDGVKLANPGNVDSERKNMAKLQTATDWCALPASTGLRALTT